MKELRSEEEIIEEWIGDIDQPLVSINCLTYNHESFIEDSIEGFLIQETTFPFEVLIHDDASTDNTASIIREYEKRYPKIIKPYYQKENQWTKDKEVIRKVQYGRMRGKYIALCEGDDYWIDPLKLQKQVEFLEENQEYSMCVHNAIVHFEGEDNRDYFFNPANQKSILKTKDLIEKWSFATASIILRKEMLDITNINELSAKHKIYNGDLFLSLLMSLQGPIKYLPDMMSVYRRFDLERYKDRSVEIIDKKIELFSLFNTLTESEYYLITQDKIKILRKTKKIQQLYTKFPVVKKIIQSKVAKIIKGKL